MIRNDFEFEITGHIKLFLKKYKSDSYSRIDYPEFMVFTYPHPILLIMPIYKIINIGWFYCLVLYNFSTMKFTNEILLLSSESILSNSFRLEELLGE